MNGDAAIARDKADDRIALNRITARGDARQHPARALNGDLVTVKYGFKLR